MVLGELNDTVPHIKARQEAETDARAMTTQWPERHPEEAGEGGVNCTMHSRRLLSMTMRGGVQKQHRTAKCPEGWLHGRHCLHWNGGSEVTFQDEEEMVREGTDTLDSEYVGLRAFILFQKAGKVSATVMGNVFYSN